MINHGQYGYDMGAIPFAVRAAYPSSLNINWNTPGGPTLTWFNPAIKTDGSPITQRTITVHIYRNDILAATLFDQVPGWAVTWQDQIGSAIPPRYRVSANLGVAAVEGVYAFTNKPILQTDNVESISYNWSEIYGTNNTGITGDNETLGPFPIGFTFPFYAQLFDNLNICSNGFASFTSMSANPFNEPIPSPGEPNNLLAVLWDDLMMVDNSNIWYANNTSVGRFIVEWDKPVSWMIPNASQKFEMMLYPNGYIDYLYLNVVPPTQTSSTIGTENAWGTGGIKVTYNADGIYHPTNGTAIRLYTQPIMDALDQGNYATGGCSEGCPECNPASQGMTAAETTDLVSISPNPFNPVTTLRYTLQSSGYVNLKVYDTTGRLVAALVDGWFEAGTHQAVFDGSTLASGIYLYRLEAGQQTSTGKMMLLK